MGKTKIEWADVVWNPVTGCSKVSEGCRNCYAESLVRRFNKDFKPWTAQNAAHNVRLHPERLEQPLRWTKPRMVFVNSVSDLFHEEVPAVFIHSVFAAMMMAKRHKFQILTKRPERMAAFLRSGDNVLPNVWLGVSAEDQETFDKRVTYLLQTPAAVRFVSLEPLLGPVQLKQDWVDYLEGWSTETGSAHDCDGTEEMCMRRCPVPEPIQVQTEKLDWVIVGGESGPGARPMHPDWIRKIRDQCQAAGVPFFLKQRGEWLPAWEAHDNGIKEGNLKRSTLEGYVKNDPSMIVVEVMLRVGKKAAGNELDGRIWEEMPA